MSLIKEFEVGAGGVVSLFKGDDFFVYKRPHRRFDISQLVEYETQLALWKRYNDGFVKPLFSEMKDERLCFAMEWFQGRRFCVERVKDVDKVAKTFCRCFQAMEDERVYHQDLECRNILWNEKTDDVKIIDFGMVVRYEDDTQRKRFGPSFSFPPKELELLDGMSCLMTREEASKAQIWALGDLLLQLLTAKDEVERVRWCDGREAFEEDVRKLCDGKQGFTERAILAALQREAKDREILFE
ncbi:serine/threonine protein kinase [Tokyovirus A1]|uniref:serine/threonine protein kinase n=1 Tax=Tokyovirus A1 TaxID=1826170 RepID=UPI0007A96F28|nr:serine/threonine protein kinase [Tokyovirus A1]BAU79950.1 serine/threonine protein kinase [Tokyovirus A1]